MSLTNRAVRSRIERALKYWRPIMGLQSWGLDIRFDLVNDLATCDAKPAYEEAVIRFNVSGIKRDLPPTYLAVEELVVHELCHCLVWRSSERVTSWVTRSILRARDAGR